MPTVRCTLAPGERASPGSTPAQPAPGNDSRAPDILPIAVALHAIADVAATPAGEEALGLILSGPPATPFLLGDMGVPFPHPPLVVDGEFALDVEGTLLGSGPASFVID